MATTLDASDSNQVVSPTAAKFSRRFVLLLFLIMLSGTILRVATLSREALDGDEIFSVRVALLPIGGGLDMVLQDLVHPPLYYALLKAGIAIWGASPLGLRLWSLIFGIATILIVPIVARGLSGSGYTGILAAAILALNEVNIFYSQEARSYALYTFLVMCLLLLIEVIAKEHHPRWLWPATWMLMVLLVYTHYVAAVYVFVAVAGIVISSLPFKTKIYTVAVAALAALAFVPWVVAIAKAIPATHGLNDHVLFHGRPTLYDLKLVWASSIGVMPFKGGTTISLLVAVALAVAAFLPWPGLQSLRRQPVLVAFALLAIFPPVIVFMMSQNSSEVTLFGLRHLLPSVVIFCMLSCYGLEKLSWRSGRYRNVVFAGGCSVLLLIATATVTEMILHRPVRYPYDVIANDIKKEIGEGRSAYALHPYGVGRPVNYYCGTECVQTVPGDRSNLPDSIVVIYRPAVPVEVKRYRDLINHGYVPVGQVHYTNGRQEEFGTTLVRMVRNSHSSS